MDIEKLKQWMVIGVINNNNNTKLDIQKLLSKYKRRLTALNITVKKMVQRQDSETSFYVGRVEELEKVIDELEDLLQADSATN